MKTKEVAGIVWSKVDSKYYDTEHNGTWVLLKLSCVVQKPGWYLLGYGDSSQEPLYLAGNLDEAMNAAAKEIIG